MRSLKVEDETRDLDPSIRIVVSVVVKVNRADE